MADEVRKRSSWVGSKKTDMEKYIVDIDKDVFDLYEEKSINIQFTKRYAYLIAIAQG